jgi:hypothetical protein
MSRSDHSKPDYSTSSNREVQFFFDKCMEYEAWDDKSYDSLAHQNLVKEHCRALSEEVSYRDLLGLWTNDTYPFD